MTEITNIRVYDLEESIIASGYPMMTKQLDIIEYECIHQAIHEIIYYNTIKVDDDCKKAIKAIDRFTRLAKSPTGSGHQTSLRGVRVSFDLKYPNYLSPELQRYNFIDIVSSSSKMHRITQMDMNSMYNEYVDEVAKHNLERYVQMYRVDPSYKNFMRIISNCPLGIELFMRISTNYLQLINVYNQRKTHKLKEDWGAICSFIETLPLMNEILNNEQ